MARNSTERPQSPNGEQAGAIAAPAIPIDTLSASSSKAVPQYPVSDTAPSTSQPTTIQSPPNHPTDSSIPDSSHATSAPPRVSVSYAEDPRRDRSDDTSGATAPATTATTATTAASSDDATEDPVQPARSTSILRSHRRSRSVKRSSSQKRNSFEAAAAAATGVIKKTGAIIKLPEPKPVDPLQEPRRSIGKRPDELHLAKRDPHTFQHGWWKHQRRAVPFAAPYERSGVVIDQPAKLRDWIVPGPLTFGYGQWWYLVFAQGLIAAVISGSINFGIAVAMYRSKSTVDLWTFDRQTVAGDMGVTVLIQQTVSFIITSTLVHHDLYAGPIGPLRRPWPPLLHLPSTPSPQGHAFGIRMPEDVEREGRPCRMGRSEGKSKLNGWWWWFVRAVLTGSERNDLIAAGISWRQRLERLVWTAAQGFLLSVLTFWWYWPIAIAIVAPIYDGKELAHTWVPEIIKLLFGGVMSLLTNPVMALMAMGAEVSVRRCYPELPLWYPFGGKEDFAQWKIEHGVADRAELGEAGVEGSGSVTTDPQRSPSNGSSGNESSPVMRATEADAGAVQSEKPAPRYQSSNLLERRITEEPSGAMSRASEQEKQDGAASGWR